MVVFRFGFIGVIPLAALGIDERVLALTAVTRVEPLALDPRMPFTDDTRLNGRIKKLLRNYERRHRTVQGLARSYGDAPVGTLVAILGSSGRLEIAQVGGAASDRLGLGEGDAVRVRRRA